MAEATANTSTRMQARLPQPEQPQALRELDMPQRPTVAVNRPSVCGHEGLASPHVGLRVLVDVAAAMDLGIPLIRADRS